MLCHELDLSNAFAESPFRRVMAMGTRYSEGQVDGMTILIEYENGVTSSVEGGWYLPTQSGCIEDDFVSIVSAAGVDEMKIPHQGYLRIGPGGLEVPNSTTASPCRGWSMVRCARRSTIWCAASFPAPSPRPARLLMRLPPSNWSKPPFFPHVNRAGSGVKKFPRSNFP